MRKIIFLSLVFAAGVFAQQDDSDALDYVDESSVNGNSQVSAPAPVTSEQECSVYSPCKTGSAQRSVAQSAVQEPEAPVGRGGFFFSMNIGGMYNNYHREEKHRTYGYSSGGDPQIEEQERTYTGSGPLISMKIGGSVGGWVAPHFAVDFGRSFGETEEKKSGNGRSVKVETSSIRFFIGGGATCFLSNNPASSLYGFFLNVDFGAVLAGVYAKTSWDYDEDVDSIIDIGIGVKFEAGKVWHVSDRFFVGISTMVAIDDAEDDEDSRYTKESSAMYTVGVSLNLMRR